MSKSVLTALAISAGALGAQAWPGPLSTQDLDREPERAYTLILDGKEVALQPGQEVRIEGKFENPSARLELGATRHFAYAGIGFDYPAEFVWEPDVADPAIRMWTMDGSDITLMVFRFSFGFSAEEYADSLGEELDEVSADPIQRKLGGQALAGVGVRAEVAGSVLLYEVLEVPSQVGSTLLVVMDATEAGMHTAEYQRTMELLATSFRVGGPVNAERLLQLEEEIADVRQQIEVFEVTYTDEQPILKELRDRLAKLEAELERARAGGR